MIGVENQEEEITMKSKKVVSLMLAAAMTAGLVTGCVKPTAGNAG